jgi:DNA-binding transcriptional LysR family regulator
MELRQLRYFLAVARTLNFTRAAEEMHIAQPPLSRQIANLEDELGLQLLERGPRSLRLTPAGEFFAIHAREILQKVRRLKEDTSAMASRNGGVRTVRAGVELSLLYGPAPIIVKHMRKLFPDIRSELEVFPAERLLQALKEGEIDIACGRELAPDSDIEQRVIRKEALVLAVPADHPAASAASTGVSLSDLAEENFIVHSLSVSAETDTVKRLYDDAGISTINRVVIRDLSAVLGMVAAGLGLAIVPAVAKRLRSGDVHYVPLKDPGAETTVVLSVANARHRDYFNAIYEESVRLARLEGEDTPAR